MATDPLKFKAPYFPAAECWDRADSFREDLWPSGDLPIDVLAIAEFGLGLEIRVIDGLKLEFDVDALLAMDWKTLAVDRDQYMEERFQRRLRYSVAHELGHYVLHRKVADQMPKTEAELVSFYSQLPEKEYSFLEYHANEFAGRLLVPRDELERRLTLALRALGLPEDMRDEGARVQIIPVLATHFAVSSDVIEIRLNRENLWPRT